WATTALGFSRERFLVIQLFGICFFALFIPIAAILAEHGRRRMMIWVNVGVGAFGLVLAPLFTGGTAGATLMMVLGLSLVGLVDGPLATFLSEMCPPAVWYSGSSLTFTLAGIFGASLSPYVAPYLAKTYGIESAGYFLSTARLLSLAGLAATRETKGA